MTKVDHERAKRTAEALVRGLAVTTRAPLDNLAMCYLEKKTMKEKLERLRCNVLSFGIDVNEHRLSYEPDEDASIFTLLVYPTTPVGSEVFEGDDLEALLDLALERFAN